MRMPVVLVFPLLFGLPASGFTQQKPDASAVLAKHCSQCHNKDGDYFDAVNHKDLTDKKYIVAGKPDESPIYKRIGVKQDMPPLDYAPDNQPDYKRPTPEEMDAVKAWIQGGLPAPVQPPVAIVPPPKRTHIAFDGMLKAIQDDLIAADPRDQPMLRYFTLTHLHNNLAVNQEQLRLTRAALSKTINSLSWKRKIVLPRAVDKDQTIFAINIRDLDWDTQRVWSCVMAAYPYGLKFKTPNGAQRNLEANIYKLTGDCEIPYVRADWFVATATQPALYHAILFDGYLPDFKKRVKRSVTDTAAKGLKGDALQTYLGNPYGMTDYDLEKYLEVTVERNLTEGRDVARSAFTKSFISTQNRMVERHESRYGAYWKSYDFKNVGGKANLIANPLGPVRLGHKYPALAFEHDGGEIIYNLPNGLQAYYLADGKGNRIDKGPIDVVRDKNELFGRVEIHNGLSCMACHTDGMKPVPKDEARHNSPAKGGALELVQLLYPEPEKMNDLVDKDKKQFLASAAEATNEYLQPGVPAANRKPVTDFAEPIVWVAKRYYDYVDLTTISFELNSTPADLKGLLKFNKKLVEVGLAPLVSDGKLDRRAWEAGKYESVMQKVGRELDYTPSRYTKD